MDYGRLESDGGYPDALNSAAERERALREENERLRGKCNRLIRALDEFDDSEKPIGDSWDEAWIHLAIDDLTPEPHGAASEGEGE